MIFNTTNDNDIIDSSKRGWCIWDPRIDYWVHIRISFFYLILILVPVWNALGYVEIKIAGCGYEYQVGIVWPESWSYNTSTVDVSIQP